MLRNLTTTPPPNQFEQQYLAVVGSRLYWSFVLKTIYSNGQNGLKFVYNHFKPYDHSLDRKSVDLFIIFHVMQL